MEPVSKDENEAEMLAVPTADGVKVVEATPVDPVTVAVGETEPPMAAQSTVKFWTGVPKNETERVRVAVPLRYIVPAP